MFLWNSTRETTNNMTVPENNQQGECVRLQNMAPLTGECGTVGQVPLWLVVEGKNKNLSGSFEAVSLFFTE